MATKKPARIVLNFEALAEVQQAVAMGVLELGKAIAEEASHHAAVSEDPRYGHVREKWGVAVYAFGKKVGNASADGTAAAKPRALRTGKETILGIVGFDFPGRFLETGTSDTRAQPFLAPAAESVSSRAPEIIAAGAKPYWPKAG